MYLFFVINIMIYRSNTYKNLATDRILTKLMFFSFHLLPALLTNTIQIERMVHYIECRSIAQGD